MACAIVLQEGRRRSFAFLHLPGKGPICLCLNSGYRWEPFRVAGFSRCASYYSIVPFCCSFHSKFPMPQWFKNIQPILKKASLSEQVLSNLMASLHSRSDNEMRDLKAGGWQFNAETEAATAEEAPLLPASLWKSKSSQVKGGDHACRGERTELWIQIGTRWRQRPATCCSCWGTGFLKNT